MQAHLYGSVDHRPDAINLAAYPGLTYAPQQHGEGIRFAHNGKPVEDIIALDNSRPYHMVAPAIDSFAKELGVSFSDVCDALKFLRDTKAI